MLRSHSTMPLFNILRFIVTHPLNRKQRVRAVARAAYWQLISRVKAEVSLPWVEGSTLVVRRGMTGATGNIYCGLHEFVEMLFLLHLLRPGDVFIDAGANVGSFTILATKVCGARAVAFEPCPETCEALRRNIVANAVRELTEVHQAALGASNGEIAFTVGLGPMNRVATPHDKAIRRVPLKRLDDFSGAEHPTMLKLDVEGFEEQVIKGASRVLASPRLLAVQSELRTSFIDETLAAFEFKPAFYDPFERKLGHSPFGFATYNTLYLRDEQAVVDRVVTAPARSVLGNRV
jgi:FkbM family methyltransferase